MYCSKTNAETFKAEVVGFVQAATFTERTEFDQDKNIVCMQNGIYHLDSGEFEEHNPEYKLLQKFQ